MIEKEGRAIKKKKKPYNFKIEIIKAIVIFLILVGSSILVYYFFFYTETCFDTECFSRSLVSCDRVKWINDAEEATWFYTLNGKLNDKCEIDVKLLQVKRGKLDLEKAEGEEMKCFFPPGTLFSPEQNLGLCTGRLKESLQDLIIKRMHSYILKNLENINEEIGNLTRAV